MAGNDSKDSTRSVNPVESASDFGPVFVSAGIEYRTRSKWEERLGVTRKTFEKWQAWGSQQTPALLQSGRGTMKEPLYGSDEIALAIRAPSTEINDAWNQKKLANRKRPATEE